MEYIDLNTWARRDAFALFSKADWPFYSVTIPVEVTRVKAASKERGLSFYHLMIWVCTKAINSVPDFRLRIRGDAVARLDRTDPSFTTLRPGAEAFQIITMPWEADPAAFCAHAKARCENQTVFLDHGAETDGLIYFSCTPWFDFTALTNERSNDRDDTIPHLAWGRYFEDKGGLWVHLSVDVNHRTIDGLHIGRFVEALGREIAAL